MPAQGTLTKQRNPYIGWIAAGIFLAVTIVGAAAVWIIFHPL
jgi:hypothetical protein